jgi:hypothetical protein
MTQFNEASNYYPAQGAHMSRAAPDGQIREDFSPSVEWIKF